MDTKPKIRKELPEGKVLRKMAPGYVGRIKKLSRYAQEGVAIEYLFRETYRDNVNINEILIKVMALDSSYSTNLRRFSSIQLVAEVIESITDFDSRLKDGDPTLVDEICDRVQHPTEKTTESGKAETDVKYPKPFSFATKYCCNHNPDKFPIYDSFVAKVLAYYQKKENFLDDQGLIEAWQEASRKPGVMSKAEALKDSYEGLFYPVITKFRDTYCKGYSYRDLDHFLWLMGKEYLGEGMPDEIEEESVVLGDYVVVIEEWDSVSIYKLCTNTTEALNKCAEQIEYARPENSTDAGFAKSMIKAYSGSEERKNFPINRYYVDCRDEQVKVYLAVGERKAKATMREIEEQHPFGFDNEDTTRQNGKRLVKYVKSLSETKDGK